MRWLVWGFEGQDVADPWGDGRDDRWYVGPEETLAGLLEAFAAQAARPAPWSAPTTSTDAGPPGRAVGRRRATALERVLLHLLQEYARHVGHLDVVRELRRRDHRRGVAGRRPRARTARSRALLEDPAAGWSGLSGWRYLADDLAGLDARGADVELLGVPPTVTRMLWMFGFQRRGVRRWECEMLLPKLGFLPQTSQVAATGELQTKGERRPTSARQPH